MLCSSLISAPVNCCDLLNTGLADIGGLGAAAVVAVLATGGGGAGTEGGGGREAGCGNSTFFSAVDCFRFSDCVDCIGTAVGTGGADVAGVDVGVVDVGVVDGGAEVGGVGAAEVGGDGEVSLG